MESKLEFLMNESLLLAEQKFKDDNSVKAFEKVQNEFKELVSKGITKERCNNLLSPSDSMSFPKLEYNTK